MTIAEQAEQALWPTPDGCVINDSESPETFEARRQRNIVKHVNGNGMGTPLAMATKMWPTMSGGTESSVRAHDETVESWQARRERKLAENHNLGDLHLPLGVAVSMWATPQANADAGSRNCDGSAAHQGTSLADMVTTGSSTTGRTGNKRRLNPRFVAWLMGFNPDWCAELSRVDALRCYGNAVVPAHGAYAMRLLMEALSVEG